MSEAALRPAGVSPDVRLVRFQAVLRAAAQTRYYAPRLEAAALREPWHGPDVTTAETALRRLPPTDLTSWLLRPDEFVNRQARPPSKTHLFFPGPRPCRTALLRRWGRSAEFNLTSRLLAWFPPDLLVGSARHLGRMAEAVQNQQCDPLRVNLAVVAWIGPEQGFLDEATRDLLWRTFQVPVFVQLVGPAGEILAWECEAHDGLHVESSQGICEFSAGELLITSLVSMRRPVLRLRTGLTGAVTDAPCPCGVSSQRLTDLRRRRIPEARVAVAGASAAAD
ncbi:MAG: hypothetical protein RMK57_10100 [Bryobacterales bacterium]|nr:hypothetical protein [Bryobacteraceae bacterium]MDW8354868.1 hypothetical protein [Bryobacterales bacterium]